MHQAMHEAAHEATHEVADLGSNVAISLYVHCVSLHPMHACVHVLDTSCSLRQQIAALQCWHCVAQTNFAHLQFAA